MILKISGHLVSSTIVRRIKVSRRIRTHRPYGAAFQLSLL